MTGIILQRIFWGDYGSVLMHGDAFERSETDFDLELPTRTIIYQAILPIPLIVFPTGFFICHTRIRDLLAAEFQDLKFSPVYMKNAVIVPWRNWIRKGICRIPRSGEPEDYFREYDEPEEFEPGFSSTYWSLEVDDFVYIEGELIGTRRRIPRILGSIPDKPFVWGGVKPGVRGSRAMFCSDKALDLLWDYREVLEMFVIS